MKYKDYYDILGLQRGASADDIKGSYRKLARKYHPDVNKAADAEDRFKEIGEAYQVLKDPEKRAAYDRMGSNYRNGQDFQPPPNWDNDYHFGGGAGGGGEGEFLAEAADDFGGGVEVGWSAEPPCFDPRDPPHVGVSA